MDFDGDVCVSCFAGEVSSVDSEPERDGQASDSGPCVVTELLPHGVNKPVPDSA